MKNPVTTIVGVALALVSIIGAVGLITQEQAIELSKIIPVIAEAIASLFLIFKAGDSGGV